MGDIEQPAYDDDQAQNARDASSDKALVLRLPFNRPYDWSSALNHLAARAIPGVEEVGNGRYRRTVSVNGVSGTIEVAPTPDGENASAIIPNAFTKGSQPNALDALLDRLRRQFDLDAEVDAISIHLGADPRLASSILMRPGLRVPGAWDAFELAVRAILGQRVSVAAATSFAGKLAFAHGDPVEDATLTRLFPSPNTLADADLTQIGFPTAISRTISGLARAVIENPGLLQPYATLEETTEALCRLPGIGPWTAHYVAMRALREPDAFPASDLGLLRALETEEGRPTPAQLLDLAQAWRPWRAYAAMHLWMIDADRIAARRAAAKSAKRTIGSSC